MKTEKVNKAVSTWQAVKSDFAKRPFDSDTLLAMGKVIAYSAINTASDPQARTAARSENVSNSACHSIYDEMRRDIARNMHIIDVLYDMSNDDDKVINAWLGTTLGDGMDVLQEAVVNLLALAREHYDGGENWLDKQITYSKPKKTVVGVLEQIQFIEQMVNALASVYRPVRAFIRKQGGTRTDARNGYTYFSELVSNDDDENALDYEIFRRAARWSDFGMIENSTHGDRKHPYTVSEYSGNDNSENMVDYYSMIESLNLTANQLSILRMRERGMSLHAIAEKQARTARKDFDDLSDSDKARVLKNARRSVQIILNRIGKRAIELGYISEKDVERMRTANS